MTISLPSRPDDLRERLERLTSHFRALSQRRIDDIVGYATAESCRHGFISAHFGSPPRTHCDVCDNCTGIQPELPDFERPDVELPDDADIEPMILDCLVSSPKPIGRGGLARVLTGSLRAPVAADECRHHGRLFALGEGVIIEYVDELIAKKLLRQYERGGYPVLAPTLKGRNIAEQWLDEHPDMVEPTARLDSHPLEEETPDEEDPEIYTALQKALYNWRRRTADEQGIPTYVIMSNDLMFRIAENHPTTLEELASLPGIGQQRLEKYGDIILDLVKLTPEHEDDQQLLNAQKEKAASQVEQHDTAKDRRDSTGTAVSPRTERQIYLKMQEIRQKIAVRERTKPYLVANNSLLKSIAGSAPQTEDELLEILGFRSSGLRDDAEQIVQTVSEQMARQSE